MVDPGGGERACYDGIMSDRKYRHRGYQDGSHREDPTRRAPTPGPRERPEGPRGRGLGAPTTTVSRCRACGHQRPAGTLIAPEAVCEQCRADLHTCSNCAFFDSASLHQCRKPVEEPVLNKTRANRCPLFSAVKVQEFGGESSQRGGGASPRDAFDALFRKG